MECARGLCCALRFWSPSARPTAGAREVSEEARFGQVRKALTTRYDNSTAATGIRLCEWVGRLLSVVHVATSCVINVSPGGLIPRGGILARAVPNLRLARDASGRRGGGFRGSHVPDRRI